MDWTIGFGRIKYPDGSKVKKTGTCTHIQAETWLKMILHGVDACLDRVIKVIINQNQHEKNDA